MTPTPEGSIGKLYLEGPFGPLHLRYVAPQSGRNTARPMVLLTPAPNSGELYNELMLELGRDRVTVAFDTPGYGESAPPREPLASPLDFAAIFAHGLQTLRLGPVDAFGHHSGAMLSLALAAYDPALVGRVVISGTPFVADRAGRADLRSRYPTIVSDEKMGEYRDRNWNFWVGQRPEGLSLERAVELYADSLCAGTRMNWLYRSAYSDDVETWLPGLATPVLALQIDDFLTPNNLEVTRLVDRPTLRERGDLDHFAFMTKPGEVAAEIRAFCDEAGE